MPRPESLGALIGRRFTRAWDTGPGLLYVELRLSMIAWQKLTPFPPAMSVCTSMADPQLRLRLLGRQITLAEAREEEDDILQQLGYPQQRIQFCVSLLSREDEILHLVAFHLNIDRKTCTLSPVDEWRHGSFNFSIPIYINWRGRTRVILRVPLPYKVGESQYPGNIDEKLRCEAATYIHIQKHCPDVPIPKMWGFGFTDGSNVHLSSAFYTISLPTNSSQPLKTGPSFFAFATTFVTACELSFDTRYLLLSSTTVL